MQIANSKIIVDLKKKEQKDVLDAMELTLCTPSLSQAIHMKKLSADGELTTQRVEDILSEITETRQGNIFQETYQYPSRKAMKKMKTAIKFNVNSRSLLVASEEDLIKNLNPKITGWRNYYTTKTSNKWMQALD